MKAAGLLPRALLPQVLTKLPCSCAPLSLRFCLSLRRVGTLALHTEAISARGLVMALAYPRMPPAINELFHDSDTADGSPEFLLISCQMLNCHRRTLELGCIQRLVYFLFAEMGVAIGFMTEDGTSHGAPGVTYERKWQKLDRIVVLQRQYDERALKARKEAKKTERAAVHGGWVGERGPNAIEEINV